MICHNCNRQIGDAAVCPFCRVYTEFSLRPYHLPAGAVIGGRYRIRGVLGEGGFGVTYLGFDNVLERKVAVKEFFAMGLSSRNAAESYTVTCRSSQEEGLFLRERENFLKEAKLIAQFSDEPGIVNISDFVEENNTAYIVMEYLDGRTLSDHLKEYKTIEARQTFRMLLPVMRALEKMHAAGVIHRDISPDNIMMLKDGTLKLMDFGAAKNFINDSNQMFVILKRGYAPPEQYVRGGKLTPAADVYALCATIYKCITGRRPVDADSRIPNDPLQRPSQLGVAIPDLLEQILMRGLAPQLQERIPDMRALRIPIESALTAPPQPAAPQRQPEMQRIPAAAKPADEPLRQDTTSTQEKSADQPRIPFGVSLKIWLVTMVLGTIGMCVSVPILDSELPSPTVWLSVLLVLLAFLLFTIERVFAKARNEQSKNAIMALSIFLSFAFFGVLILLPLAVFL